ncbi:hypothetical protein AK830_g8358 [Neonectria ditissima]|uniref:Methyltransferase domain-containing protein n=1 Tax=Neonectria ditissima TaxID=78410 RepID=A0A0N8H676_9HYPO|nr:hypothetical protein AK830_g8358 [Neonectria ditissima]
MTSQAPPIDFKARLKASYDAMAPTYNTWTESHHRLRLAYLDELCARLPKLTSSSEASSVLELGCGSGKPFLDTLLTRGPGITATANDFSDTQVDLARTKLAAYGDRVRFIAQDMNELSFPDGSLTAVVALYSIIHLTQDEQTAMLHKIAGWLEPGGYLVSNFSVDETDCTVNEKWLDDKGWMFWSGLGLERTAQTLADAGLKVEQEKVEGDEQEKMLWVIARR